MGVSTTSAVTKLESEIINKAYNECPHSSATNIVSLNGVKFYPPPDCVPPSDFTLRAASTVNAECVISNLQDGAAKEAANLSAPAQTGLGVAVSKSVSDVKSSIKNIVDNKCGTADTKNLISLTDTEIKSCKLNLITDASAKEVCVINSTQEIINDIATRSETGSKGSSILGLLFGEGNSIFIIIIILVVVVIVGGVLFKMLKSGGEEKNETNEDLNDLSNDELGLGTEETGEQVGGFDIKKNKSFTILLIILLILLVFALLGIYYKKTGKVVKKINEEDMKKLNDKINDATEIAGFSPNSDNYYRINC